MSFSLFSFTSVVAKGKQTTKTKQKDGKLLHNKESNEKIINLIIDDIQNGNHKKTLDRSIITVLVIMNALFQYQRFMRICCKLVEIFIILLIYQSLKHS